MKAVFPNEEKSYVDAQMFMIRHILPWGKKPSLMRYVTCLLLVGLGVWNLYLFWIYENAYFNLIVGLVILLFGLFYSNYISWIYKKTFKKHFALSEAKEFKVEVDKTNIKSSDEFVSIGSKTKNLKNIFETNEYFYLQITPGMVTYIPKKHIEVDEVCEELKGYAEMYSIEYIAIDK